jgi:hypothetical protein
MRRKTAAIAAACILASIGYLIQLGKGLGAQLPDTTTVQASAFIPTPTWRVWEVLAETRAETWLDGMSYRLETHYPRPEICWLNPNVPMQQYLDRFPVRPWTVCTGYTGMIHYPDVWTFDLQPVTTSSGTQGTRITITESISNPDPLQRSITHYLRGDDAQLRHFLKELQAESVRQR